MGSEYIEKTKTLIGTKRKELIDKETGEIIEVDQITKKENTKASETTIAKVMKKLQEQKFLKKIQNGLWQVSPNIMMKGNENKKQLLLSYFCNNNTE